MSKNKSAGILQSMKAFMKMTPEQRKVETERVRKHKTPEWHKGYTAWRQESSGTTKGGAK